MPSLWTENTRLPRFEPLRGDAKTDVLIIGGGMAGLLCAYQLQQAGVNYLLVEADRICAGVTANTTAKVTAQHGLIYHQLIRKLGMARAAIYLRANLAALEQIRTLCAQLDCAFSPVDSYVYSLSDRSILNDELAALERLRYPAKLVRELPRLPFPVAGAVRFPNQGQFDPLEFAAAVAQGLHIHESTPVRELAPRKATTTRGVITADRIIIATHFPMLNKHGAYPLKMYQHRSYVLALENAAQVEGAYLDEAKNGLSFRNHGKLLLLGGGDHRTGKQGGGWRELREFAERWYPQAAERYHWATQDCMTLDGVPYIGPYCKRTPDLFVATGFNKWGMTGSMAAAMILSEMVQGRESEYAPVFDPSRSMLNGQLALNALEATRNLLTPTTPRCPHMGCALKWNKDERSWDCPCHGSRFDGNGKLLDNPATGSLARKPRRG